MSIVNDSSECKYVAPSLVFTIMSSRRAVLQAGSPIKGWTVEADDDDLSM